VNGSTLISSAIINFRDNSVMAFTNPSFGNIEASIKAGSITDSMLAGVINPAKINGTAETLLNKNAANGYAPLDATIKLPLANLPSHVHAESDVTNLVGDLAGKAATSHTHAATDITSGTLNAARLPNPSASTLGGIQSITCSGTDKLDSISTLGVPHCGTDQTAGGGTGITTLNTLTAATQTFVNANDTNVTLSIGSATSTHTFTMGWTGTLAKARQHAATVYNDQTNTFGAGLKQIFTPSASVAGINFQPLAGQPNTPASGDFNNNNGELEYYNGAAWKRLARTDGNITGNAATATALAADGTNCSGNNFAIGVDASGTGQCAQPAFTNLSGSLGLGQTVLTTRGDMLSVGAGPAFVRVALSPANRYWSSNGTDTVWGQIDLANGVTGITGFANGGTGQTSQQAAINALLGLNTAGDIAIYDGTNVTRLAKGSAGTCLTYTGVSPFIAPGSCATGAVGGTGTTNKFPIWTASNSLGDSVFSLATNEFQPVTDNVSDLGDGSHRIRNIFFTGSVAVANGGFGTTSNTGALGKIPIGDGAGHFVEGDPVISYNNGTAVTAAWTSATSVDTAATVALTSPVNFSLVTVTLRATSTMTAGTLNFEADDGSGNYSFPISCDRMDTATSETTFALSVTNKAWHCNVSGFTNFRVRLNPAITGSGTANVRATATTSPVDAQITAAQSDATKLNGTMTVTNLPTTVDVNSGNKSASTPRGVIATDQVAIPLWGHGATGAAVPANATMEGLSDGTNLRAALSDATGRQIVKVYPDTGSTSYHTSKKFAASSTTDNAVMPGNATNTVLLTKVTVTCTQTTAGILNLELVKRSAADTSGTSAAFTIVPDDSNYAAAVSAPLSYTGTGPTAGSAVGDLDNAQIGCLAAATAAANDIYVFKPAKPIVLRGTAQQVAINLGGAVTGGNITVTFDWIETTTP
jgi:hypothetical protein